MENTTDTLASRCELFTKFFFCKQAINGKIGKRRGNKSLLKTSGCKTRAKRPRGEKGGNK